MGMLMRMELTMENDEVLVVPGPLVPFLEIGHVWDWNDPLPSGEDNIVTTFEHAVICIAALADGVYPTASGVSTMGQLERIARFRDISWIDLFYEDEDAPQSFFVPYEDDRPTPVGTPNRLMQTTFDEAGNLWIYIDGDKPPQQEGNV